MMLKVAVTLLALASSEAFSVNQPGSSHQVTDTALHAQKSFLYTGGTGGSSLVSEGRVDIDAPWGSNNPNLHNSKPYHHQRVQHRAGRDTSTPGSTGGANGSTFVSDVIEKDSLYGKNYHRFHGYQSSRPRSMMMPTSATNNPALPSPETVRAAQQQQPRRVPPQQQQQQQAPRQQQRQVQSQN